MKVALPIPDAVVAAEPPKPVQIADHAPLPPVTYHLQAGVIIGGLVSALVFALLMLLRISTIASAVQIGVGVGVIIGGVYGVLWTYKSSTYPWMREEEERRLRWERETAAAGNGGGDGVAVVPDAPPAERLDYLARLLLEREFIDRKPTTREAMTREGWTQPEWNKVIEIMKACEIRSSRSWEVESYEEAVVVWRARVKPNGDAMMVQVGPTSWRRIGCG